MHRLRYRARVGMAHLRTVFDAARAMLGRWATILRHQHRRDGTAVGGKLDSGHERGQQCATRQLRRLATRHVGQVHVRAGREVRDVRHLRTTWRPHRRRNRGPHGHADGARGAGFRVDEREAVAIAGGQRPRTVGARIDLHTTKPHVRRAVRFDVAAVTAGGAQKITTIGARIRERDIDAGRRNHSHKILGRLYEGFGA